MKSNFLKSEMGVEVKAKLCRGLNSRKLLGRKVLGIYLKLILEKKIFHKNYSHLQKNKKKRLSTYFLHIFFVKLNFIQKHKTLSPKNFLQFESQISCVLAPNPDFYKKLIASMPQKSKNGPFLFRFTYFRIIINVTKKLKF